MAVDKSRRMKEFITGDIVVCWGSQRKKAVAKSEDGILHLEWFDGQGHLRRGTVSVRRVANHYIKNLCDFCGHRAGDHPIGPCDLCLCPRYIEKD